MHLSGTCIYHDDLCYFTAQYHYDDEKRYYDVYELTPSERLKWYIRQRLFEICVGYHWSYKGRKRLMNEFVLRDPKWLYRFLFNAYYIFQ
jgi:hypothetical protein